MKDRKDFKEIFELTSPPDSDRAFAARLRANCRYKPNSEYETRRVRNPIYAIVAASAAFMLILGGAIFALNTGNDEFEGLPPLISGAEAITQEPEQVVIDYSRMTACGQDHRTCAYSCEVRCWWCFCHRSVCKGSMCNGVAMCGCGLDMRGCVEKYGLHCQNIADNGGRVQFYAEVPLHDFDRNETMARLDYIELTSESIRMTFTVDKDFDETTLYLTWFKVSFLSDWANKFLFAPKIYENILVSEYLVYDYEVVRNGNRIIISGDFREELDVSTVNAISTWGNINELDWEYYEFIINEYVPLVCTDEICARAEQSDIHCYVCDGNLQEHDASKWADNRVKLNVSGGQQEFTLERFHYNKGVVTFEFGITNMGWFADDNEKVWNENEFAVIGSFGGLRIDFEVFGQIEFWEQDGTVRAAVVAPIPSDEALKQAEQGLEWVVINGERFVLARG
jgi:hypothetical protein